MLVYADCHLMGGVWSLYLVSSDGTKVQRTGKNPVRLSEVITDSPVCSVTTAYSRRDVGAFWKAMQFRGVSGYVFTVQEIADSTGYPVEVVKVLCNLASRYGLARRVGGSAPKVRTRLYQGGSRFEFV